MAARGLFVTAHDGQCSGGLNKLIVLLGGGGVLQLLLLLLFLHYMKMSVAMFPLMFFYAYT